MRVGMGYDVHKFSAARKLVLGGVTIPSSLGLLGHSDADVLTHAIMDALLGAAALGDIGAHFPDTDKELKDINSIKLLQRVMLLLKEKHYTLVNLDTVIIAESPRLAPFVPAMRETLAHVLEVEPGQVSIKCTTTEGLGFTGRKEGIAAAAVVLIDSIA